MTEFDKSPQDTIELVTKNLQFMVVFTKRDEEITRIRKSVYFTTSKFRKANDTFMYICTGKNSNKL